MEGAVAGGESQGTEGEETQPEDLGIESQTMDTVTDDSQPLDEAQLTSVINSSPAMDLSFLNEQQHKAVTVAGGAVIILAGPGSGKTRVATTRVIWLIKEAKVRPEAIVMVTFTNKAATEMRTRVTETLGERAKRVLIGTFHSICARLLRSHGTKINLPDNFTIADTAVTQKILKDLIEAHDDKDERRQKDDGKAQGIKMDQQTAASWISKAKAQQRSPADCKRAVANADTPPELAWQFKAVADIYAAYQKEMTRQGLLDFDDLLLKGLELVRKEPSVVQRFSHVLVDEFQDTNSIQYDLCKALAHAQNFTVVGDPDQSIYSWRQADVRGFSKLLADFPDATQVFLEDNYRSTPNILDLSNAILEEDKTRIKKTLRTTNPRGPSIPFLVEDSPEAEAYRIALEIERMYRIGETCLDLNDFAVLTRINAMSRPLEEVFNRVGIPYRIVGGLKFFERMEVQDCVAYLKLVFNLNDDISFERVVNVPKRRVGPSLLAEMKQRAVDKEMSLFNMLHAEVVAAAASAPARKKSKGAAGALAKMLTPELQHFVTTMRRLHDAYRAGTPETRSVQKLLERVLDEFQYKAYLEESYKKDHATRWENVQELINFTSKFDMQQEAEEAERARMQALQEQQGQQPQQAGDGTNPRPAGEGRKDGHAPDGSGPEEGDEGMADLTPSTLTPPANPLSTFVETIALNANDDSKSKGKHDKDVVTISSIHAAKGLEWACVFVVGVEEGILPHKSASEEVQLNEERRLLYVACTRAKFYLMLLRARSRMTMGRSGSTEQSRFITPAISKKFLLSRVLQEVELRRHAETLANLFKARAYPTRASASLMKDVSERAKGMSRLNGLRDVEDEPEDDMDDRHLAFLESDEVMRLMDTHEAAALTKNPYKRQGSSDRGGRPAYSRGASSESPGSNAHADASAAGCRGGDAHGTTSPSPSFAALLPGGGASGYGGGLKARPRSASAMSVGSVTGFQRASAVLMQRRAAGGASNRDEGEEGDEGGAAEDREEDGGSAAKGRRREGSSAKLAGSTGVTFAGFVRASTLELRDSKEQMADIVVGVRAEQDATSWDIFSASRRGGGRGGGLGASAAIGSSSNSSSSQSTMIGFSSAGGMLGKSVSAPGTLGSLSSADNARVRVETGASAGAAAAVPAKATSGPKQRSLSSFFGAKAASPSGTPSPSPTPPMQPSAAVVKMEGISDVGATGAAAAAAATTGAAAAFIRPTALRDANGGSSSSTGKNDRKDKRRKGGRASDAIVVVDEDEDVVVQEKM